MCGCCDGEFRLSNFGLNYSKPELFVTLQVSMRLQVLCEMIFDPFILYFYKQYIYNLGFYLFVLKRSKC